MRKIIFLSEAPAYDVGVPGERQGALELRSGDGKRFRTKKQFDDYKKSGDVLRREDGQLLVTAPNGDIVYAKGPNMKPRGIKWSDKPIKK